MSKTDPIDEFGRLIKQVKVQEYERGWREAMEAIQRAAITLYRQSAVASEAASAAEGQDAGVAAVLKNAAQSASAESVAEPERPDEGQDQANAAEGGGDGQQRFVTPKWALLKR